MNTYIDNDYLLAGDTLVAYTGKATDINVPGIFDRIRLRRIGNSAFRDMQSVTHIKLPYGVECVERNAFAQCTGLRCLELPGTIRNFKSDLDCTALEQITICDLPICKDTYYELKGNSIRTVGDVCISCCVPEFITNLGFYFPLCLPAFSIPKDIQVLFRYNDSDISNNCNTGWLSRSIDYLSCSKNINCTNENEAFICQMINNSFAKASDVAEAINDNAVKSEKPLLKERTMIFTFDDSKTKEHDNFVYITVTLKVGYFFWQSGQRVLCDKQDYFVYRRYFLSSQQEVEYVRANVAVYKDNKLVSDSKEVNRVYGKYKLLSIL